MGRSRNDESSAKDVVGEDKAGLGGKRLIGCSPGGSGLRRDFTVSMAVKACGGMSRNWTEYCCTRGKARIVVVYGGSNEIFLLGRELRQRLQESNAARGSLRGEGRGGEGGREG